MSSNKRTIKKFTYTNYLKELCQLINSDKDLIKKLKKLEQKILTCKKKNKKVMIFGNGGSSAVASHVAIDLTNAANIRCQNYADSSLITCFSNDYGYENWVKKTIENYADDGDVLILISSSGMSKNMINAVRQKSKKFSFIATFSGFSENNIIRKSGNISFWVNSNIYNYVENIHQIWLLSIVDSIIAKQK